MKKQLFKGLILPLICGIAAAILSLSGGSAAVDWNDCFADPVFNLRLIRLLASFTIGGSLALAGLVFQAVLRNVLAEPFTLGVSGGASVGAALAVILGLQLISFWFVPLMALAGSLLLLGVVLLLTGQKNSEGLLLSGVIAGTTASSILMYLVSIADRDELAGLAWWMLGDLQAVELELLLPGTGILLAGTLFLRYFARELNAVALGEEAAWNLGVNGKLFGRIFIVLASLLAAQTVAMAGLIAFVGLIVPHLIRRCYGTDHNWIVIPTVLWGGIFLILCDYLSRVLNDSHELPIGVLTSAVGGALFIYVLNKRRSSNL